MIENKDEIKNDSLEQPVNDQVEFEEYNGFKVQKGVIDAFNKRLAVEKSNLNKKQTALQDELNMIKVAFEEMKISQMTEKERKDVEDKKKMADLQKLIDEKEQNFNLFKTHKIDTELFNEVSKYDVYNISQVVKLIKTNSYDFKRNDNGDYEITFSYGDEALSVGDAVKRFLEEDSNANLLKSTLKSGSGTKKVSKSASTINNEISEEEFNNLSPKAKAQFFADGGTIKQK